MPDKCQHHAPEACDCCGGCLALRASWARAEGEVAELKKIRGAVTKGTAQYQELRATAIRRADAAEAALAEAVGLLREAREYLLLPGTALRARIDAFLAARKEAPAGEKEER